MVSWSVCWNIPKSSDVALMAKGCKRMQKVSKGCFQPGTLSAFQWVSMYSRLVQIISVLFDFVVFVCFCSTIYLVEWRMLKYVEGCWRCHFLATKIIDLYHLDASCSTRFLHVMLPFRSRHGHTALILPSWFMPPTAETRWQPSPFFEKWAKQTTNWCASMWWTQRHCQPQTMVNFSGIWNLCCWASRHHAAMQAATSSSASGQCGFPPRWCRPSIQHWLCKGQEDLCQEGAASNILRMTP